MFVFVNEIGDLWLSSHDDTEGRFYELPELWRDIGGFPVITRIADAELTDTRRRSSLDELTN
jgi:hypothetical protein